MVTAQDIGPYRIEVAEIDEYPGWVWRIRHIPTGDVVVQGRQRFRSQLAAYHAAVSAHARGACVTDHADD